MIFISTGSLVTKSTDSNVSGCALFVLRRLERTEATQIDETYGDTFILLSLLAVWLFWGVAGEEGHPMFCRNSTAAALISSSREIVAHAHQ